jgi:phage tail tube protein FII
MNAPIKPDIGKRVEQYVMLRDKIKKLDDEHKEKMKIFRETLEKLNGVMLAHLNDMNGESVRTDAGTVYRTEKKSASIADGDAFMRYVVGEEAWDLLDRKANVTAVADFIEEHKSPPPGVNFTTAFVVGVRRS